MGNPVHSRMKLVGIGSCCARQRVFTALDSLLKVDPVVGVQHTVTMTA
jgi:hypothetical protein